MGACAGAMAAVCYGALRFTRFSDVGAFLQQALLLAGIIALSS